MEFGGVAVGLCLGVCTYPAFAQQTPGFEVGVIKVAQPDPDPLIAEMREMAAESMAAALPSGTLPVWHGRLDIESETLQRIIAQAYRVRSRDISGPAWLNEVLFNIEAKLPD